MLENYLLAYLAAQSSLTGILTTFAGKPAIFERVAPPDTDPQWAKDGSGNAVQYPRIVYVVDRSVSIAQMLVGTLHVQLWALDGQTDPLFALHQTTEQLLDGACLNTNEGLVSTFMQSAQSFRSTTNSRVQGMDLAFAVQSYTAQTTYAPCDPIYALNRWAVQYLDPRIQVAPAAWSPATDTNPALYFRTVSRTSEPRDKLNWGWWEHARIEGHVLAPDAFSRGAWVRLIAQALKLPAYRRIGLQDGSPLRCDAIVEDLQANPYRQGQLRIDCTFGVQTAEVKTTFDHAPLNPIVAPSLAGESGDGGMAGTGGSVPPAPITYSGPPAFQYTSQPLYVSIDNTGQPLHTWQWSLHIPRDGTATPFASITPPAPLAPAPAN